MMTPSPAAISTSTGKTAMAIRALSPSFFSSASKNQPFQRLTVTLAKTERMIALASVSDQSQARPAVPPRQKPPVKRAKLLVTCQSDGGPADTVFGSTAFSTVE